MSAFMFRGQHQKLAGDSNCKRGRGKRPGSVGQHAFGKFLEVRKAVVVQQKKAGYAVLPQKGPIILEQIRHKEARLRPLESRVW
jgi:hypothetical protein